MDESARSLVGATLVVARLDARTLPILQYGRPHIWSAPRLRRCEAALRGGVGCTHIYGLLSGDVLLPGPDGFRTRAPEQGYGLEGLCGTSGSWRVGPTCSPSRSTFTSRNRGQPLPPARDQCPSCRRRPCGQRRIRPPAQRSSRAAEGACLEGRRSPALNRRSNRPRSGAGAERACGYARRLTTPSRRPPRRRARHRSSAHGAARPTPCARSCSPAPPPPRSARGVP